MTSLIDDVNSVAAGLKRIEREKAEALNTPFVEETTTPKADEPRNHLPPLDFPDFSY